jgi:hypothetical protein
MTYLEDLESELAGAGIPARRRARIVAEFSDHLEESEQADLGAPAMLARQFADEIGTRLARTTAYRAFAGLFVSAVTLGVMFLTGGRSNGWVGYGSFNGNLTRGWYIPMLFVCALSAQVALAAGSLALIRAWRLRRLAVISHADALILNRRAAVGLAAGVLTMSVMPLTFVAFHNSWRVLELWSPYPGPGDTWFAACLVIGPLVVIGLLVLLRSVLTATRLRPSLDGEPGDVLTDIGIDDARLTPWRMAIALSAVILIVLTLVGAAADDPFDGLARGLADAAACIAGFALLGRYLGLRSSREAAQ